MPATIPELTQDQQRELDSICENEQLMEFMESGIPNQGETYPDEVILERQRQAVKAFSQMPSDFWSFK